jgi:hypothetical protein
VIGVPEQFLVPLRHMNGHRNALVHRGEQLRPELARDLAASVRVTVPSFNDAFRIKVSGKHSFDKVYAECSTLERYAAAATMAIALTGGFPEIMAKARKRT